MRTVMRSVVLPLVLVGAIGTVGLEWAAGQDKSKDKDKGKPAATATFELYKDKSGESALSRSPSCIRVSAIALKCSGVANSLCVPIPAADVHQLTHADREGSAHGYRFAAYGSG
jgi:hypothetical protein